MKKARYIKFSFSSLLLAAPTISFAENASTSNSTYFSSAFFNTLAGVILFLLIVIVALSRVLKNLADSDLIRNNDEKKDKSNGVKATTFLLLTVTGLEASARSNNDWTVGGLDMFTFYFMLGVILLEVIFIATLLRTIHSVLGKSQKTAAPVKKEKSILEKLNASVEIGKEEEIMTEHVYDGIRELDNDLPPWWRYGFYLSIVVAVVYMIHYHVAGTGDLQLKEYENELAQGKAEVEAYMKLTASNVDETTVKMMPAADIEAGKAVYLTNCAACHGKSGEGSVGPNLTDDYWLHQGSISDIFKSIKYGWPDKGMKSWKEDFSPTQIAQLSSFIKSLKGSNPANGKAPQGDLFSEAISDTTKAVPDSTVVK